VWQKIEVVIRSFGRITIVEMQYNVSSAGRGDLENVQVVLSTIHNSVIAIRKGYIHLTTFNQNTAIAKTSALVELKGNTHVSTKKAHKSQKPKNKQTQHDEHNQNAENDTNSAKRQS
jgi:hypothetical protein